MRHIIFRAWDGSVMHENVSIVHGEAIKYGYHGTAFSSNAKAGTPMQFTGLCDKNGREIYEGDIVRAFKHNEDLFTDKVRWRSGILWFGNWNWIEFQNIFRSVEVIGNKFENPELLEAI